MWVCAGQAHHKMRLSVTKALRVRQRKCYLIRNDFADCRGVWRGILHMLTQLMLFLPTRRAGGQENALFRAVGGGIEVNHRIFRKQIAVGVEFEIIAGFVKQHLLGVFQVLPHGQFRRVRILADQRF